MLEKMSESLIIKRENKIQKIKIHEKMEINKIKFE